MEKLMNILMEIDSSIAWDKEEKLIDDRIMDSFMVISLISELEDQFQIEIDASEIIPENLNSVNAMWRMITKLQELIWHTIQGYICFCFCRLSFCSTS